MARRKLLDISPPDKFYAYFDPETKQILMITNKQQEVHKNYAEISFEDYRNLTTGKLDFKDYIIDHVVKDTGEVFARMITVQLFNEFAFKTKSFTWINTEPKPDTEFIVEWNPTQWAFTITDEGRKNLVDKSMNNTLVFFVMLETDFDFLIRTIHLQIHDLLRTDKLRIDFESPIEKNLKKISIASKTFFNSYGLRIND